MREFRVDVYSPAVGSGHPLYGYGSVRVCDVKTGMVEECSAYRYAHENKRAALDAMKHRVSQTDTMTL